MRTTRAGLAEAGVGPLVAAFGGIGACCLVAAVAPVSAGADPAPLVAVGMAWWVLAGIAWLLRARPAGRVWLLALAVLGNAGVVAASASLAGVILASTGFTYLVLAAACVLDRPRIRAVVALVAVTSLGAMAVADTGLRPLLWLAMTGAAVVAGEVLGRALELLRLFAATDSLTGALTRAAFAEVARGRLATARRHGVPVTLALVDLDNFKAVNDSLGHAAGDELLVSTVGSWRGRLRAQDEVGRIGGDEFALLLPDTGADQVGPLLHELREVSPIAFSVGVAQATPEDDVASLLARADVALYECKARGRQARHGDDATDAAPDEVPAGAVTGAAGSTPR